MFYVIFLPRDEKQCFAERIQSLRKENFPSFFLSLYLLFEGGEAADERAGGHGRHHPLPLQGDRARQGRGH